MTRSDAERNHNAGYKSIEGQNYLSHFQTAETLGEINQKTLTVRDQFAIAALQGMLSGQFPDEMDEELYATRAYILADAMMEARNK